MNYLTLYLWAVGTILAFLLAIELTLNWGNRNILKEWYKNYKRKKQQRYDLAVWRIHKGIASKKDETIIKKFKK